MSTVFVISPGGTSSTGGICRMVRDAALAWNARQGAATPMRVVDSGGMDRRSRMPAHFAFSLARTTIACMTGRAALLHVHVAARGSVARKACFVLAARAFGVPAILHMHGADFEEFYGALGASGKRVVRAVFRIASGVVVLGPRAAAHLEIALGVARAKIHTLPNAVPAPPGQRRTAAGAPHLVFLGALTERKGVDTLLAALASPGLLRADWRLTLVGNGDHDRWRTQAAALGLASRVTIPGWLPGEEARAMLAGADALILPARQEAMPMVILEAMAAGVAVVSTPVGEIAETVLDGATGLLVPPGDAAALAGAISRLLASPAERAWLGRQGQLRHRALFDLDTYAERLGAIYARVLPDRLPAPSQKVVAPMVNAR